MKKIVFENPMGVTIYYDQDDPCPATLQEILQDFPCQVLKSSSLWVMFSVLQRQAYGYTLFFPLENIECPRCFRVHIYFIADGQHQRLAALMKNTSLSSTMAQRVRYFLRK